jgi:phage gp46-like protein
MVALRLHTPKHIRGGWSHYTDNSAQVEVMGLKIWSLSNPGFGPATFRSLVQRANHCANWALTGMESNTVSMVIIHNMWANKAMMVMIMAKSTAMIAHGFCEADNYYNGR